MSRFFALAVLCAAAAQAPSLSQPPAAAACQARSADRQALLVELYTSEGCNACPPADRWLSTLQDRPQVIAAAFHVDYWDRLGWVDRFGSARHTERQSEMQRQSGAGFSYTPQVLVNGRDWRGWPTLPVLDAPAKVRIALRRQDAQQVAVSITPQAGAPARLALWWALLEDGHVSRVSAGENNGVTLRHDHVVRQYGRLPAWDGAIGAAHDERLPAATGHASANLSTNPSIKPPTPSTPARNGEGGHKARLLVVVTDAATGTPLQAAELGC